MIGAFVVGGALLYAVSVYVRGLTGVREAKQMAFKVRGVASPDENAPHIVVEDDVCV